MNAFVVVLLLATVAAVAFLPKRLALLGLLLGSLFLTQGAALDIAGFNFFPTRLLAYVAFARVLSRGEFSWGELIKADKIFIGLYLFTTLILLTRTEQESPLLVLAKLCDSLSLYIALRGLIRSADDFRWILGALACALIPYVGLLVMEGLFRKNLFQYVGGEAKLWEREGKLRCFGSFRHPSLLGSLGACFFPLFVALAFDPRWRKRALLGCLLCLAVIGFSNSGGPISVLTVAIIGWVLWPMRARMKTFRRGLAAMIVLLGLVMEAPIWYLLARVSSFTGGTGWHRSYLMDVAFRRLGDWWLVGLPIEETRTWMPYVVASTGGADITNQFIAFGLQGGIWAMGIFICLIVAVFSILGRGLEATRQNPNAEETDERLLWGLGVALAAHVSNWLGITYFDQFQVFWLLQLAAMIALSQESITSEAEAEDTEEDYENVRPDATPVNFTPGRFINI